MVLFLGNYLRHYVTRRTLYPDMSDKLDDFRAHLIRSSRELPDLKAWQLQGE